MAEEGIPVPSGTKTPTYEDECKKRIDDWRVALVDLAKNPDLARAQGLKAVIDADLALADFKIKARQADHAKGIMWSAFIVPAVTAILGALIGGWLKTH
jgi:hypothetical protein